MKKAIGVGLLLLGFVVAVNAFLPMVAQAQKAESAGSDLTVKDQLLERYDAAKAFYKDDKIDKAEKEFLAIRSEAEAAGVDLGKSVKKGIDKYLKLIQEKRLAAKKDALMKRFKDAEALYNENKYEEAKDAFQKVKNDAESEGVNLGFFTSRKLNSYIKKCTSKAADAVLKAEEDRKAVVASGREDAKKALKKDLVAKFKDGEQLYKDGKYVEARPVLQEVSDQCGKNDISLGYFADHRLQKYLAEINDKIIAAAKAQKAQVLAKKFEDGKALYKEGNYADAKNVFEDIKSVQESEDISLGFFKDRDVPRYISKSEKAIAKAQREQAQAKAAEAKVAAAKPAEAKAAKAEAPKPKVVVAEKPVVKAPSEPEKPVAQPRPTAPKPKVAAAAQAAPVKAVVSPEALKKARAEAAYKAGLDAYMSKDYQKAQKGAYKALSLRPGYEEATLLLEMSQKKLAELKGPRDEFEKAAEARRQAKEAGIRDNLSNARKAMVEKDYIKARGFLQKAKSDALANIQMGFEAYVKQADLMLGQVEGLAAQQQAELDRQRQRKADALIAEEKSIRKAQRKQQVKALMESANFHLKQEDYTKAAADLQAVLEIDPNNAYARVLSELVEQWSMESQTMDAEKLRQQSVHRVNTEASEAMVFRTEPLMQYPDHWKSKMADRETYMSQNWGGYPVPESLKTRAEVLAAETKELRAKLDERIPSFDFPNATFDIIMNFLRNTYKLNIVVDKKPVTDTVSLQLTNVSVRTVLELVTKQAGLEWTSARNYVFISDADGIRQFKPSGMRSTVVYDIHDLIAPVEDWESDNNNDNNDNNDNDNGGNNNRGGGSNRGGDDNRYFGGETGGFGGFGGIGEMGGFGGIGGRTSTGVGGGNVSYSDTDDSGQYLAQMIMTVIQPDIWMQDPERYNVSYLSGGKLIVYATPDAQEEVREFLADLRRLQAMAVLVDARMITVSSGFLDKFAVNYPLIDLVPDGDGGAWTIASGALQSGSMVGTGFATGIGAGTDEGLSFNVNFYDGIEINALVEAVQKSEDYQTLNQPRIMLANGQMGYIDVSTDTDYISDLEPTVAESAVAITPTTDTISTGTTLAVRPTISYDGRYVQLALEPDVSQLVAITPYTYFTQDEGIRLENTIQLLTTSDISLRSTVSVPDGGTAMLGGLTLAGDNQVQSGVPVLSNLPIIGKLFKKTGVIRDKQVIIFLVTPHVIIRDEYEASL